MCDTAGSADCRGGRKPVDVRLSRIIVGNEGSGEEMQSLGG